MNRIDNRQVGSIQLQELPVSSDFGSFPNRGIRVGFHLPSVIFPLDKSFPLTNFSLTTHSLSDSPLLSADRSTLRIAHSLMNTGPVPRKLESSAVNKVDATLCYVETRVMAASPFLPLVRLLASCLSRGKPRPYHCLPKAGYHGPLRYCRQSK